MNKKSVFNINMGSLIISALAFVLAFFSTFRSCKTEKELVIANYKLTSVEHRPRLKVSKPLFTAYRLYFDSIPFKKNLDKSDSIGDIKVKLSISIRATITNIGNSNAQIIGWAVADTLSEEPILKKFLKERNRESKFFSDTIKFPHIYRDIVPFDTTIVDIDYRPQFIKNDICLIHIMIFYENDLGQLYDTYYWIKLKMNSIIIPNPLLIADNQTIINEYTKQILKLVELKTENNYSSIYSEEEKILLFEALDDYK